MTQLLETNRLLAKFSTCFLVSISALCASISSAAVNPPVTHSSQGIVDDGRKVVLIYLANESSDVPEVMENKNKFREILSTSGTQVGHLLSNRIAADGPAFISAVDSEIQSLTAMIGSSEVGSKTGALIATNRSLLQGQVLVIRPGVPEPESVQLNVKATSDRILKFHPLSRAEVFADVLAKAAMEFSPATHKFVLITKSHGGKENIMSLLLGVHADELDQSAFVEDLMQKDQRMTKKIFGPEKSSARKDVMGTMQSNRGITRAQYLHELAKAGELSGMEFSVVFAESCSSGIGFGRDAKLPENVTSLFTSDQTGLFYQTISYRNLLLNATKSFDILVFNSLAIRQ